VPSTTKPPSLASPSPTPPSTLRLSFNNICDEHNITGDSIATAITANSITANGTTYADSFNSELAVTPASGVDAISVLSGRSVMFSITFGLSLNSQ
jgi:iron complex outermembrane receptor protein